MGFLTKILNVNCKVCVCAGEQEEEENTGEQDAYETIPNEEPVTCSICLDDQTHPFLSSCNHSFCLSCLVRASEFKGTSKNFPCPLCRVVITNMEDAIDAYYTMISETETESMATAHLPPFLLSNYPLPEEVCFDFINDAMEKYMISTAYTAISKSNKWNILYHFLPKPREGFMWTQNQEILSIMNNVADETEFGHSGCSMGFTMRNIHFIAKYGYHEFRKEWCKWSGERESLI